MKKRTLVVGDIHGCLDELIELLSVAKYKSESDRLIFVGDLISKGPDSLGVLKWVKESRSESILGNHELGFLNYLNNPSSKYKSFLKLKKEMGDELESYRLWLGSLPLYIDVPEQNFCVVHAGVIPEKKLHEIPAHIITQIRTWDGKGIDLNNKKGRPWYEFYESEKLVIYGHWAAQGLKIRKNTIGIDSGCCWGGKLTLLWVESREVFQVAAKAVYAKD